MRRFNVFVFCTHLLPVKLPGCYQSRVIASCARPALFMELLNLQWHAAGCYHGNDILAHLRVSQESPRSRLYYIPIFDPVFYYLLVLTLAWRMVDDVSSDASAAAAAATTVIM